MEPYLIGSTILSNEIWKDIPNFIGLYQISNFGRIRSVKKNKSQKMAFFIKERILKQMLAPQGYYKVDLYKNHKRNSKYVHRLLMESFIDNPENKPQINHINGIKTDNRIENLEWCTRSNNIKHAWTTKLNLGYKKDGELNPNASLTNFMAKNIRLSYFTGELTRVQLSKKYNVSVKCISDVINYKTYKK